MSSTPAKFDVLRLGNDAKAIENLTITNAAIARLASRRVSEIRVEGPLAKSKIAWKVATFEQAILYRTVMLAEGAAEAWNSDNFLTCILAARSLSETFAVLFDFENKLSLLLSEGDLSEISAFTQNRLFSNRDAVFIEQHPCTQAVNVMTVIKKLDRDFLHGILVHYESLSERCHPNAQGHHQMFATTDKSDGTVKFSESKRRKDSQDRIIGSLMLVPLIEGILDRIDEAVLRISELQHQLDPVGSNPTS